MTAAASGQARSRSPRRQSRARTRTRPIGVRSTCPPATRTIVRFSCVADTCSVWLAPSSPWSFTARLTLLMTEKLNLAYSAPDFFGEDVYPLQWSPATASATPDIGGLPSIDHALYLFETVKFHLGQNYRFFDEEAFVKHMREFYSDNPVRKAAESRLWFVQFLLVLAFGKAFLSRSNARDPPGSKYFVRAMSLMPEITSLWKDSIMAIEVLALAGLYLYSIDQRESAHVYVCARRIACLSVEANDHCRSVKRYASRSWRGCTRSCPRTSSASTLSCGAATSGGRCTSWTGISRRLWGSPCRRRIATLRRWSTSLGLHRSRTLF